MVTNRRASHDHDRRAHVLMGVSSLRANYGYADQTPGDLRHVLFATEHRRTFERGTARFICWTLRHWSKSGPRK